MSLPVVNLNVDYEDEKGAMNAALIKLITEIHSVDKIQTFLSNFKGRSITHGFADLDISGQNDDANAGRKVPKYMQQLVRASFCISDTFDA